MRQLVAASMIVLTIAGCGRTAMATGAVISTVGALSLAAGVSNDDGDGCSGNNTHDCVDIDIGAGLTAFGVQSILLGMLLIGGGVVISKFEDERDQELARDHAARSPAAIAPLPVAVAVEEESPAPPSPPRPYDRGVWRDVPAVPGDDGE